MGAGIEMIIEMRRTVGLDEAVRRPEPLVRHHTIIQAHRRRAPHGCGEARGVPDGSHALWTEPFANVQLHHFEQGLRVGLETRALMAVEPSDVPADATDEFGSDLALPQRRALHPGSGGEAIVVRVDRGPEPGRGKSSGTVDAGVAVSAEAFELDEYCVTIIARQQILSPFVLRVDRGIGVRR